MDMTLSLCVAGGFLATAVFAGWRGARPPNPHRGPRLIPWRFLMLLGAVGLLFTLAYIAELAGLTPAQR